MRIILLALFAVGFALVGLMGVVASSLSFIFWALAALCALGCLLAVTRRGGRHNRLT